jgi:PAS domain S-box-containing protein
MIKLILKILFGILFFTISAQTHAQNVKAMEERLLRVETDTAKISGHIQISKAYIELQNFKIAYQHSEQALTLSEKNKNYKIGECYFSKALAANLLGNSLESTQLYEKSIDIFKNNENPIQYIDALEGLASVLTETGDYGTALNDNITALDLAKKIGDSKRTADNLKSIGKIFSQLNKNEKALEYFSQAMEIYQLTENIDGEVRDLLNISYSYIALEQYDKALENANQALEINKQNGNELLDATCYNALAKIYKMQGNIDKSFDNILRAYEIFQDKDYQLGTTICLISLGELSLYKNDTLKAHKYFKESLSDAKKGSFKPQIQDIYMGFSDLYSAEKNYQISLEYYKKFNQYKDSIFNEDISRQVLELSAKYESVQKENELRKYRDFKKFGLVLIFLILVFISILFFFLRKKSITLKQLQYQQNQNLTILETLHKQKNEIQEQTQKLKATNLELEKLSLVAKKTDNTILIADIDGDVEWVNDSFIHIFNYTERDLNFMNYDDKILMEIVRILNEGISKCKEANKPYSFSFNFRDQKKEKHWYQTSVSPIFNAVGEMIKFIVIGSDITQVKLAEMEIKIQHTEIEMQRDQIVKQNNEIMSSILYAERIQKAVLPPFTYFNEIFPDSFIFYKPKDIVSGDFFWISEKNEKKIVAVADCTGHGVPGAFMSMLGIVLLNEIVNKHQDLLFDFNLSTNQILNLLRTKLKKSLHQKGLSGEANDGIDIALCIIDYESRELLFSGANLPIYICNDGKVIKYSGDRMPIGVYTENDSEFNIFNHPIVEGDTLYMASDGYSDQLGGPIDKKFLVKNFREMLASICELPPDKQKEIVCDIFEGWKGNEEQTDDIVVVGIKL